MNPTFHSQLSAKRHGGQPQDYYPAHDLMDSSKEAESSNAHRALTHHLGFVKNVMIPVFGHTLTNSAGIPVNLKDMLEQDHLLADFHDRFLPTLADYMELVADDEGDTELIRAFDHDNRAFYEAYPQVRELMLYPLGLVGSVKALLITHNSWFVHKILPLVFPAIKVEIRDYGIAPAVLFNRMTYADWLNNGRGNPPSFAKINEHRKKKIAAAERRDSLKGVVFDGGRNPGLINDVLVD